MSVVVVEDPPARSRLCETVPRDLPEWFGIGSATSAYPRARTFDEARGFAGLEEIHELWEHNPCLLMVKRL